MARKERPEARRARLAVNRAAAAERSAHHWHQGSGAHASNCLALTQYHAEETHRAGRLHIYYPEYPIARETAHANAAVAWAEAAKAEAAELKERNGEWASYRTWKRGPAGLAAAKAGELTRIAADLDKESLEEMLRETGVAKRRNRNILTLDISK